ncbi:MAG: hypothetical protein U9P14_04210, partial [Gemmatimonadota bacterium]|nr:hypothetical protein [Gemmatimonadota bacterium]
MQIASGSGPDLSVVPVQRSDAQVIKGGRAEYVIEVAGKTQPVGRSIEITGPARDVKLTVEGGLDFSSMEALAASVATAGMTDEEKVKACFYLAVDNFYDRGSTGCEAPLEYISLWGFSWCGNFALFLDALWTAAGFPCVFMNPVIGHNGGHTIAVVYYDNQWHMYDARLRGYFLNRDNRTVASLVELDRDDDLIRRALDLNNRMVGHWSLYTVNYNYYNSSSDWYDGYNAHFGNKTLFHKDCPPWDPRLDLRQGEKITLRWDNRGKWWNRKDLAPRWLELHPHEGLEAKKIPPLIYANGTLETTVDPRLVKKQAKEFNGIRARKGKFQPAGAGRKATVVYRVRVPYFIPSMRVVAQGYRKTEDDCLAIDISADEGKTWQPVWQAERTGTIEVDV